MKVKFSGPNIVLSAESAKEVRVLQAACANSERKEKVRCSRIWVGDVDSQTDHLALTLTLEKLRPVDCNLDRKHTIAEPVTFPTWSDTVVVTAVSSSAIPAHREDLGWPLTDDPKGPSMFDRIAGWLAAHWPLRGRDARVGGRN